MQHQQTQSAAWYKSIKQRSAGIPKGGEGALQLLFALSLLTVCTSRCPFQPDTFSGLPWFCDTDTRNLLCLLLAMPNCMLSLCLKEGTAFPDSFTLLFCPSWAITVFKLLLPLVDATGNQQDPDFLAFLLKLPAFTLSAVISWGSACSKHA